MPDDYLNVNAMGLKSSEELYEGSRRIVLLNCVFIFLTVLVRSWFNFCARGVKGNLPRTFSCKTCGGNVFFLNDKFFLASKFCASQTIPRSEMFMSPFSFHSHCTGKLFKEIFLV